MPAPAKTFFVADLNTRGELHAQLVQGGGGKPATLGQQAGVDFPRLPAFQRIAAGMGEIGHGAAIILPGQAGRPAETAASGGAGGLGVGEHAAVAVLSLGAAAVRARRVRAAQGRIAGRDRQDFTARR